MEEKKEVKGITVEINGDTAGLDAALDKSIGKAEKLNLLLKEASELIRSLQMIVPESDTDRRVAELENTVVWLAEAMRTGKTVASMPKLLEKALEEKNRPEDQWRVSELEDAVAWLTWNIKYGGAGTERPELIEKIIKAAEADKKNN